jgi:hypothetical protein
MVEGSGIFGVRRCRSFEAGEGVDSCLFKSTEDFNDESKMAGFNEIPITMKQSNNFYQIIYTYDVSLCKAFKNTNSNVTTYYCSFQIIGANKNP